MAFKAALEMVCIQGSILCVKSSNTKQGTGLRRCPLANAEMKRTFFCDLCIPRMVQSCIQPSKATHLQTPSTTCLQKSCISLEWMVMMLKQARVPACQIFSTCLSSKTGQRNDLKCLHVTRWLSMLLSALCPRMKYNRPYSQQEKGGSCKQMAQQLGICSVY